MDIAIHFGLVVPVGIDIFIERDAVSHNIVQMALPAVAAFISSQAVEHGLIGGPLQLHIEGGVNLQSALVDLVSTVLALKVAANLFDKIGSQGVWIMRQTQ